MTFLLKSCVKQTSYFLLVRVKMFLTTVVGSIANIWSFKKKRESSFSDNDYDIHMGSTSVSLNPFLLLVRPSLNIVDEQCSCHAFSWTPHYLSKET